MVERVRAYEDESLGDEPSEPPSAADSWLVAHGGSDE